MLVSWRCACDCEGFGFADLPGTISGIEIIRGIVANTEARSSPISRKKSSAGCFRLGDLCVSEVVGIVRLPLLAIGFPYWAFLVFKSSKATPSLPLIDK